MKNPWSYGGAEGEAQLWATVEQDTATLQQSVRWPQNMIWDWLEPDGEEGRKFPMTDGRIAIDPQGLLPLLSENLRIGNKRRT